MSVTPNGIVLVTADANANAGAKEVDPEEGTAGAPRGLEPPWRRAATEQGPTYAPIAPLTRTAPNLEEVIMIWGLPRRRSDPNMAASAPGSYKRTQ